MTPPSPLPGVLGDIARIAGRETALDVAERFGGRDAYVRQGDGAPISDGLAADVKRVLGREFGGTSHYIPRARRHVAQRLFARGMTVREVATRLGVTRAAARKYHTGV